MSTWTDFRDKETSQKITLVEIDLPQTQAFWLPAEAGIWKFNLVDAGNNLTFNFQNGCFTQGSFENSGVEDLGLNAILRDVGSFKASGINYTATTTWTNLRSTNRSYLFDISTAILYVHFDSRDPPSCFSPIIIGVVRGFSTKERYFSDSLYEGRIKSVPSISIQRDPLYFGLIIFGGGSISLYNQDGRFDDWKDEYVYGQPVRIKFGGDGLELSDYYTLFTGYVEDFRIDSDEVNIDVIDDRKRFSRSLPVNVFDTTNYPNIKTSNANKSIPIAYGTVTNAPIMCIDEGATQATYNFVICDVSSHSSGIKAINQIYIDKGDGPIAASAASESLTAATFVLTAGSATTQYEPGDDITADIEGYTSGGAIISNGLHIMTDIMGVYVDRPYNTDVYNTTEWASAQAAAYDCCQWIDSKKTIIDIIEELSISNFGNFIVQSDGKYTFRMTDEDRATAKTIVKTVQLAQPAADFKSEEFLTSAIIKYNKNQAEDEYIEYPDTSRQTEVFNKYSTYREREFETNITNATDAAALAVDILDLTDTIVAIFTAKTKTQNIDIQLLDNIILQVDRMQSEWFGNRKCEVIGITHDMDNYQTTLQCRDIEAITFTVPAAPAAYPGTWTADSPVFSVALGGSSAVIWDKNWTTDQKVYALANFGYWTDDDGYIDATDSESYMGSMWEMG